MCAVRRPEKSPPVIAEGWRLLGWMGSLLVITNPLRCLEYCKNILRLYTEEGMNDDSLFKTHNNAFQVCIMHGDMARASAFAALAVTCLGAGDPSIKQV